MEFSLGGGETGVVGEKWGKGSQALHTHLSGAPLGGPALG